MARRANAGVNPRWIIGGLIGIVLIAAGGRFLFKNASDPYRTIAKLDSGVYLENSNSLRGNIYKVSGTIEDSLAWNSGVGRLFSLMVNENQQDILPIFVPAKFNSVTIQRGQQFQLQVEVREKGILNVVSLEKL